MKQILADITPVGSNNLFVTHYWPDKQTDPPLHYHEDYMLCLTLHVRGQRIMDDAVEDFTEKDLVLINPGTPHRFKRDAAYADAKCETATVMFSREMPDWKFLSLEHMRPIREMLLRPAAGLRFAPKTIDTVLERMISLPKLDGFEAVSLFFSILNDLAQRRPTRCSRSVRVTTVPTRTTGCAESSGSWRRAIPANSRWRRSAVRWTCPRRRCAATSNAARTRTCGNTSTASASTGPRSSSSRRSSPFRK